MEAIEAAQSRVAYVYETLTKVDERLSRAGEIAPGAVYQPELVEGLWGRFAEAMEDDFNAAAALGVISEAFPLKNELVENPPVKDKALVARTLAKLRETIGRIGAVLGVWQQEPQAWLRSHRERMAAQRGIEPAWVEEQIRARAAARQAKDFAAADQILAELQERGVEIMDSPSGTTWRVVA